MVIMEEKKVENQVTRKLNEQLSILYFKLTISEQILKL